MRSHDPLSMAEVRERRDFGALGDFIRSTRKRKGITTAELASAMGVTPGTVSEIERGGHEAPLKGLRKIAARLGVPLKQLTSRSSKPEMRGMAFVDDLTENSSHDDSAIFRELSTKEINDLPDSSFAHVTPGGDKDERGRSPGSHRKLPYLDSKGRLMEAQASAALAALNGARGGVDLSREEKSAAWNKVVSAIKKVRGSDWEPPPRKF